MFYKVHLNKCWVGWFNVGLELRKWAIADGLGFIPKNDRRHAIAILIRLGGDGSPALVLFGWELGGHCSYDGFYMHKVLLACMAVFARRASNPGPPVRS